MEHEFDAMKERGQDVKLGLVLGHVGIAGNGKAWQQNKQLALITLLYTDYHAQVLDQIREAWQRM